jgi:hypothetical protein
VDRGLQDAEAVVVLEGEDDRLVAWPDLGRDEAEDWLAINGRHHW